MKSEKKERAANGKLLELSQLQLGLIHKRLRSVYLQLYFMHGFSHRIAAGVPPLASWGRNPLCAKLNPEIRYR